MKENFIEIISGVLIGLTFLATGFGIYHAFKEHSTTEAVFSLFPPYAIYMTIESYYWHDDGKSKSWDRAKKNNFQHILNAFNYEEQIRELEKNRVIWTAEESKRMLEIRRKLLNELRTVEDATLETLHPDMKYHFRYEYQKGHALVVLGYDKKDNSLILKGYDLIDLWFKWFEENKRKTNIF